MEARYAHHLVVSRNGAVRDRNVTGTKPIGPVLGWVLREADGKWQASLPGGILLDSPVRTRYAAVKIIMNFHRKATPVVH